ISTYSMNIKLIAIGKTDNKNLQSLIDEYQKRLSFYIKFDLEIIPDIKNVKNLSESQQKEKEGELILAKITPTDQLILLDENGKTFSSVEFSEELQKKMNSGVKTLVFVIGGPYGFSEAVYAKAQGKISLSPMTFSHQMVRLFFIEQLYRGFTILKNEPYHHQ
ncbi:MAG TPA: 23S rRNA (pseudouridine(1915)-N(3))-methyltransferase RlmH, partial [Flavobacterium sp.]|nr:23S rRNA (pseudouridine(1915)-N(3))-methyltransferase RlmH [Flavobacterium sp.]